MWTVHSGAAPGCLGRDEHAHIHMADVQDIHTSTWKVKAYSLTDLMGPVVDEITTLTEEQSDATRFFTALWGVRFRISNSSDDTVLTLEINDLPIFFIYSDGKVIMENVPDTIKPHTHTLIQLDVDGRSHATSDPLNTDFRQHIVDLAIQRGFAVLKLFSHIEVDGHFLAQDTAAKLLRAVIQFYFGKIY